MLFICNFAHCFGECNNIQGCPTVEQAATGQRITHPAESRITAAVVELVELLPLCGLSVLYLLTGDQIDSLIESTATGEHSLYTL